jgi:hypothetical protein
MKYAFILLSIFSFTVCSCVSTLPGAKTFNYCYPNESYAVDSVHRPYASIPSVFLTDSLFIKKYGISNINLANATGTLDLIYEFVQLKKDISLYPSSEKEIAIIHKKQEITSRLMLCRTEIAGIAAELDCEGERAEQLSTYMAGKENLRVNKLTVASITLGALAAVAAIFIKPQKTSDAVAITGGIGSAALGVFSLSSSRKSEYMHPRNLLTDIWNEPETSSYYPPTIWYIITHKEFSNNKHYSICHNTRERWKEYNQLNEQNSKKAKSEIDLLFGKGGIYTSDLLKSRANMLNQLQAAIKLLDQDIQQLLYRINY